MYLTNIQDSQALISIKLNIAQISMKDSLLKTELLKLFLIHKLDLIAILIMVLLKNQVHCMYHTVIQDSKDSMSKNLSIALILTRE
jgi:hypothetical protein